MFSFNVLCLLQCLYRRLEENCKFVNQMFHYSNEFKKFFIVCHHKLSLHITMTLFLFTIPYNVLQMCHITFKANV